MIWTCAADFFKALLKFKIAAPNQFFFRGGGCKNLVRSYSNFRITFPTIHGDVQVISFKVLLKFEMAAKDQIHKGAIY